jgi:hypothetical protein
MCIAWPPFFIGPHPTPTEKINMILKAKPTANQKQIKSKTNGKSKAKPTAKLTAKHKQIPENENEYEIHFLSCNNNTDNTDNNKGNNTGNTDTQEISTQSQTPVRGGGMGPPPGGRCNEVTKARKKRIKYTINSLSDAHDIYRNMTTAL